MYRERTTYPSIENPLTGNQTQTVAETVYQYSRRYDMSVGLTNAGEDNLRQGSSQKAIISSVKESSKG